MENQNPVEQKLAPYAQISLILGIISLFTWCCCYIGDILAIASLVTGFMGWSTYRANPEAYKASSKTMYLLGIIFSILTLIITIAYVIYIFTNPGAGMNMQNEMLEKLQDLK